MHSIRTPFIAGMAMLTVLSVASIHGVVWGDDVGMLKVIFLDVGQGDSIFIESPSGAQVLIDGGKGSGILGSLGKEMGIFDRDIDMVLATHPDLDHIGGLIDVLERYDVSTIVMTENAGETSLAQNFQEKAREEGARIVYARRGQMYDLGFGPSGSTTLTILFPDRDPTHWESNTASIVARLVYGDIEYLFTGDSPKEIETYLISLGSTTLKSDVLKVGHHGSQTSTSEFYILAVDPKYAVISAGRDNSYGHPHREVTELFKKYGIVQINTATEGTVVSVSDGKKIRFK
jgi:competence protein ComEC